MKTNRKVSSNINATRFDRVQKPTQSKYVCHPVCRFITDELINDAEKIVANNNSNKRKP